MSFEPSPSPFREVALALLDAEEDSVQTAALRRGMMHTSPQFLLDLISVTVGTIAFRAEESPRSIYEMLFSTCPTDEEWRSMFEAWQAEGLGGEPDG